MPDIASFHPQIVHFVVVLLIVGVLFRLVSFTGKVPFTNAAATTLIVFGALAAVVAVESGMQAHGPAERVPGAREAVMEHEEWGERTRNVFLVVAVLELVGLAVRSRKWWSGCWSPGYTTLRCWTAARVAPRARQGSSRSSPARDPQIPQSSSCASSRCSVTGETRPPHWRRCRR